MLGTARAHDVNLALKAHGVHAGIAHLVWMHKLDSYVLVVVKDCFVDLRCQDRPVRDDVSLKGIIPSAACIVQR